MIRGAGGRHPGGLRLGLTRDTRRNRRHPGKLSLAGLAAHSGLAGGIRDSSGVSLGTRGDSEGSRGSLLFRHSEQVASSGGFRRKGFRSALGNTWRVPKEKPKGLFRRRVKKAFGETTFGLASGGSFEGWPSGTTIIDGLGING